MGYMGYEEKAYEDINFKNKRRPALNQTNLNAMSGAIDELDNRVLELDKGLEWVFNGAISNLQYLPASNQLLYQKGNGDDFTYINLPTPVIQGQIDSGVVSDSLAQYGITADDTALAVFNKLPQISFTMINSNAQGNNYAYSMPNAASKGCALFFKYYNNRGWLEFHSYDDPGNVYHAKVLDGQISGWVCDNILSGATMHPNATLMFPSGSDARKLEVTPSEIKFHLPKNGFAGGMGYFNDGQRVAEIGYANVGGGYYYIGSAYDNPNGRLKLGSLEAKEAITAPTFNGNASSATSASQAESAKALAGWADTRNVATKPNDYNGKLLPVGIKKNTVAGITDGGEYITLVGIRGWNDSSGGKSHEFGFTANGKLYHRVGATDTWEPWREIAHVDDLNAGGTGDATTKVSKSGDTMTGNLEFSDSGTTLRGIKGAMGSNDAWRVMGGATASNAGFLEIATADDSNEPIYVRQYQGMFNQVTRTLTLLDGNGNSSFPGTVSAPVFSGTATYASSLCNGLDVRNRAIIRGFATGSNTNQGAIFLQEDLDNTVVNIGIDGLGPIGVNLARNTYNDSAGRNIVNTYATKAEVALQFVGEQTMDAYAGAATITFPDTNAGDIFIIIAEGAPSTSTKTGDNDYGRIILAKVNCGSENTLWITSTLGSYYSGSTARFSVDKTTSNITIKVPKGAYAQIKLYRLKNS